MAEKRILKRFERVIVRDIQIVRRVYDLRRCVGIDL